MRTLFDVYGLMKKFKIQAFSIFDENFKPIQKIVEPNNKKYFAQYNIDYISFDKDLEKFYCNSISKQHQKYWSKIFALKSLLDAQLNFDWFFLIDSDALIIDHEIDLNIFPNLVPQDKELLICEVNGHFTSKFWNVNTGVFFCKNSDYMKYIIEAIINIAIEQNFFNEQPIFQNILAKNYYGLADKTAIFPSYAFNHEGSFIYHACAFSTLDMDFSEAIKGKAEFLKSILLDS